MRAERLLNGTGEVLLERCWMADRPWSRMRGLLGRGGLEEGEGLLLKPCGSVHTLFMRFPIDVVFLDRELSVLAVQPAVPPWRTARARGAKVTLELAAGEAARLGIKTGDRLRPAQEGVSSPERR